MPPTKHAKFEDEDPAVAGPTQPVGRYFVLVVAIDQYNTDPGIKPLGNPVLDATNLLNTLRERYELGIPPHNEAVDLRLTDPFYADAPLPIWEHSTLQYKCLFNKNATKRAILEHLDAVNNVIGPNDALLLFLSGHGVTQDDKGHFLCQNATLDKFDKPGWLAYEDLYAKFNNYPQDQKCRHLLLFLDCCHSGAATLGKQGVNLSGDYSREVVMACANDRLASDGEAGVGSPFALALVQALRANKEPLLVFPKISSDVDSALGTQTNGAQTMDYGPLPTLLNGRGKCLLPLKSSIAEALPAQQLASSIVKHLNFDEQKASFKKHFKFIEKKDLHVLATSAYSFDVQQLMRTVLFDYTRAFGSINLAPGDPITIWPNTLPDGGFWEAMHRSLATEAGATSTQKDTVVQHIVDRMQVTEQFANKPFVINIGFESGMAKATQDLMAFAKELMDLLAQEKARRDHKIFAKLFLILSELTPGPSQLQVKDALLIAEGGGVFEVAPIQQLDKDHQIDKYSFEEWYSAASETLGPKAPKLEQFDIFADEDQAYEIISFIYAISDKLQVTRADLVRNLGIFQA